MKTKKMKKTLQAGLLLSIIFVAPDTLKTAKTYLDPVINLVSTNLNYGAANRAGRGRIIPAHLCFDPDPRTLWPGISIKYLNR
jgi:hypothetical protein